MITMYLVEKFDHKSDEKINEHFWTFTEYWFPIPFLMGAFYDIAVAASKTRLPL